MPSSIPRAVAHVALALSLLLVACTTAAPPRAAADAPDDADPAARTRPVTATPGQARDSVLLVSLDGFRADQLDLGITPNLARLAAGGARARWMTPSYPSLTFPNHYSIVTGLRPDRHGIVHNQMHDAELGRFRVSDREALVRSAWWGGEPVWVGAEKAGLPTAAMFWPGTEGEVAGVRPTRWTMFDADITPQRRVETVAGWLSEPDATRPRFATLYFGAIDKQGHAHGPDSPQAHAAIRETDAAIGRLLDALDASGRLSRTNLVVMSDHGMATVAPGQAIAIEDMVSSEEARVLSTDQVVTLTPNPGHEATVAARLLGRHAHYECWRKDELPERWHYGRHPRVPPIVCQMDEGWDALPRAVIARRAARGGNRGSHGYDPALPSMRALFIAHGPAFRRGVVIEPFDNVDVYPLLARLLGIEPAPNDGDPATLLPALATPGAP